MRCPICRAKMIYIPGNKWLGTRDCWKCKRCGYDKFGG